MMKTGAVAGVYLSTLLLTSCLSGVWTGASLIYNRHGVYKKANDFQLSTRVNRALYYQDIQFKCHECAIDVAVFNRDILLAGHVPTDALRNEATRRVEKIPGYRRFFNRINSTPTRTDTIQDSWITTKIRSEIMADADIDPNQFKVVTSDHVVYLMGDVEPDQAEKVVAIARAVSGVKYVVKLFKYFNLSDKPEARSSQD